MILSEQYRARATGSTCIIATLEVKVGYNDLFGQFHRACQYCHALSVAAGFREEHWVILHDLKPESYVFFEHVWHVSS